MKFLANMLLFKFNIGPMISLSNEISSKYVAIQVQYWSYDISVL
jgi:hypothetical protein